MFLFDRECEPIVAVLCGKVLETAHMEVLEEEELNEMNQQQARYKKMTETHMISLQEMEELEKAQLTTHETKIVIEKERRKQKMFTH